MVDADPGSVYISAHLIANPPSRVVTGEQENI